MSGERLLLKFPLRGGAGGARGRLRTEVSAPPNTRAWAAAAPSLPGPFRVEFTAGETAATRTDGGGPPDVAGSAGLALPAGCRVGACDGRAQTSTAGVAAYTTEPVLVPPPPRVLLCCAAPTADVRVRA